MRAPQRSSSILGVAALAALLQGAAPGTARAQVFQAVTLASSSATADSAGAFVLTDTQHLLSAPTLSNQPLLLEGLARDPVSGALYSLGLGDSTLSLVRVDPGSGTVTPIGAPLSTAIRSIAFDSNGQLYGFTLCDSTYGNQLFSMDATSGTITGALGSLDSGRVAPCGSGFTASGVIAIGPNDVLYFMANDTSGNLFVDRMDKFLVPTLVNSFPVFAIQSIPLAATFDGGVLWIATGLTVVGPGFDYLSIDTLNGFVGFEFSGAAFRALSFGENATILGLVTATPACVPSTNVACIFNRFKLAVTYDATPANGSGPATVLLESPQSVKLSFFDPANIELIVKMVDACAPPFNQWWVAGGGLTNVGVTIKVTDTQTNTTKTYRNTKGQLFQAFFDTAAFPCP